MALFTGNTYGTYLKTLEQGGENGLRYISNAFGGLSFNASVHGDDKWGVGVNFAQTFGTVSVGLGAGYGEDSRVDGAGNFNGKFTGLSAGIKESNSGLFLQGAWTKQDINLVGFTDPTNWNVQGGWGKNVSGLGVTTLYVGYDRSLNVADLVVTDSSAAHTWSVGLDQAIDSAAANVFVLYENSAIDTAVGNDVTQSISAITAGMGIKF